MYTMWMRSQQIDPDGDEIDRAQRGGDSGQGSAPRPEHVEVHTKQRARTFGAR